MLNRVARNSNAVFTACRRGLHRQYRFEPLADKTKLSLTGECECFIKDLNQRLPKDGQLDPSLKLPTKVPEYHKHVLLLATKESNPFTWPSKLEFSCEYPHNVVGPLKSSLKDTKNGSGILVNELALQGHTSSESFLKFLVIPDMKVYKVAPDKITDFALFLGNGKSKRTKAKLSFDNFLLGSDAIDSAEIADEARDESLLPTFEGQEFKSDLALLCGHKRRDARCGTLAPLLVDQLKAIRPTLLTGIVSHFGGHKFAGNMIYYRSNNPSNNDIDGIWLSKLLPHNLELVFDHLDRGVILSDFYRGHMTTQR